MKNRDNFKKIGASSQFSGSRTRGSLPKSNSGHVPRNKSIGMPRHKNREMSAENESVQDEQININVPAKIDPNAESDELDGYTSNNLTNTNVVKKTRFALEEEHLGPE